MKLRNLQGILSSDVPTGNLLWVDQVNGNDVLAIKGRLTIPFQTLTAAKNAAVTGSTIIVMPGFYHEWDLAKTGVNWHFLPGAKVDPGTSATTSLFNISGDMSITGYGEFATGLSGSAIVSLTGGSVSFKCRSLLANSGSKCVSITAGFNYIEAEFAQAVSGVCLDISGGDSSFFRIRDIRSDGSHALSHTGGTTEIEAFRIRSYGGKGVYFTGGSLMVAAAEILSTVDNALEYNNSYSAVCNIIGARLVSSLNSASGRAAYITSSSNALKLTGCVLITTNSSAPPLTAAFAQTVNLYRECIANRAYTVVTVPIGLNVGSAYTVNANIT